eukprot:5573320-Amphidinium_carterae.1
MRCMCMSKWIVQQRFYNVNEFKFYFVVHPLRLATTTTRQYEDQQHVRAVSTDITPEQKKTAYAVRMEQQGDSSSGYIFFTTRPMPAIQWKKREYQTTTEIYDEKKDYKSRWNITKQARENRAGQ